MYSSIFSELEPSPNIFSFDFFIDKPGLNCFSKLTRSDHKAFSNKEPGANFVHWEESFAIKSFRWSKTKMVEPREKIPAKFLRIEELSIRENMQNTIKSIIELELFLHIRTNYTRADPEKLLVRQAIAFSKRPFYL